MNIEIDPGSGFCHGVVYAIQTAEKELKNGSLYCLGDIVHNNVEIDRLSEIGLITINHEEFKKLSNCKVLIRAHGEPPETYSFAKQNNITIIDATCPVVLRLQKIIKKGYDSLKYKDGQIVIFGKEGHAEVNGLVGQTNNQAIVVNGINDLNKIDFNKPIYLFSQTTQSINELEIIKNEIQNRINQINSNIDFITNDTICRQVSNRESVLRKFAQKHDVILFVSGKKSSNGKVLFEVCKTENHNTYLISNVDEIDKQWFINVNSVGICGATSTPRWLMEKVQNTLKTINNY